VFAILIFRTLLLNRKCMIAPDGKHRPPPEQQRDFAAQKAANVRRPDSSAPPTVPTAASYCPRSVAEGQSAVDKARRRHVVLEITRAGPTARYSTSKSCSSTSRHLAPTKHHVASVRIARLQRCDRHSAKTTARSVRRAFMLLRSCSRRVANRPKCLK